MDLGDIKSFSITIPASVSDAITQCMAKRSPLIMVGLGLYLKKGSQPNYSFAHQNIVFIIPRTKQLYLFDPWGEGKITITTDLSELVTKSHLCTRFGLTFVPQTGCSPGLQDKGLIYQGGGICAYISFINVLLMAMIPYPTIDHLKIDPINKVYENKRYRDEARKAGVELGQLMNWRLNQSMIGMLEYFLTIKNQHIPELRFGIWSHEKSRKKWKKYTMFRNKKFLENFVPVMSGQGVTI